MNKGIILILLILTSLNLESMQGSKYDYGIVGQLAPEFNVSQWIDEDGENTEPIKLENYVGKVKVIYGFQSWCPGCHSHGLPSLKKLVQKFDGNENIVFMAVQTVFEGHSVNTFDKIKEVQKKYDLKIPFGHDPGDASTNNRSNIMHHYRTGGTPWFIIIDKEGMVVFNNYHIDVEKTIDLLEGLSTK